MHKNGDNIKMQNVVGKIETKGQEGIGIMNSFTRD